MIDAMDKKIYFPRTFNEQMAWIAEEVEHIIKYNAEHNIKKNIQEEGVGAYGQAGYTHAINRLFEIIESDPKNKALLQEVCKAKKELMAFFYDEPGALSEKQIYEYWNAYLQSYIAEMESHPMHYVLIKGIDVRQDEEEQNNKFLGIYDGLARLEDAYVVAVQKLEEQHKNMTGLLGDKVDYIVKHEKIMINVFDEFTGRWHYNVKPEQLFWRKNADTDNYKMVECVFDNPYMYEVKLDKIKRTLSGYVYDDALPRYGRHNEETITVRFNVGYSYQILEMLEHYWGGWNSTPTSVEMAKIAKKWYEKYDAELIKISHDTLTFTCRKLSESEAKELMDEAEALCALIVDCKPEEMLEHLINKETFTLWWD